MISILIALFVATLIALIEARQDLRRLPKAEAVCRLASRASRLRVMGSEDARLLNQAIREWEDASR